MTIPEADTKGQVVVGTRDALHLMAERKVRHLLV
jgi:hypothetical protein